MSAADAITRRSLIGGAGAAGLLLGATPAVAAERGRQSATKAGRYVGTREDGVVAFKGIRYGRAARFARAIAEPWTGERVVADAFGPLAPQQNPRGATISEDCLFLNVWTPEVHPGARRAVMVYFHGGAYNNGTVTDPLTLGGKLAARGDVVVSVNHRLNAFGYGWLKPFGARFADSGNLGQLDLMLALAWVRDHIAEFGGDPARVMVFGQSGGGAKIATLMAMPAAEGLFHAAATMSGQQVVASGPQHAWSRTQAFMAKLGLGSADIDALVSLPMERLVEGLSAIDPVMGAGEVYFGPVLDMTNLPRHPFWPDAAPQSLGIPMILGNTHDETRAFLNPRGPKLAGLGWDNLAARIAPEVKIDLDIVWVVEQYRTHFPAYSPEQIYYAATTAGRSWPGQVIEADARARAGAERTWVYQLDRPSPVDPLRGAAHTDDLPYVFGTIDAAGSYSGTDGGARALRDAMMTAFAGLARQGRPGLADWSPYRLPDRATMLFGDRVRLADDPRRWQRELWARAPYVQPGS